MHVFMSALRRIVVNVVLTQDRRYTMCKCICCKSADVDNEGDACYDCFVEAAKGEPYTQTEQKCSKCGGYLLLHEVEEGATVCSHCVNGKCACGEENMPGEKMCYSCHYDALHHSQAENDEFFAVNTVVDGEIIPEWALEDAYADHPLLRKAVHKASLV